MPPRRSARNNGSQSDHTLLSLTQNHEAAAEPTTRRSSRRPRPSSLNKKSYYNDDDVENDGRYTTTIGVRHNAPLFFSGQLTTTECIHSPSITTTTTTTKQTTSTRATNRDPTSSSHHQQNNTQNQGQQQQKSRFKSFRIRLYSTLVLIGSFIGIIYAGHVPLMAMIFAIQTVMVKELFALARVAQQERKLPGFRVQQWYFYLVAALWVYVRFIKQNLIVEITSSARYAAIWGLVLRRHTLLCFSLYTAGFVSFVLTLRKGMYTYQFGQYAWTHMILLVVFLPSSFFVSNIFDGIIWFLLPCAMVIINDIAAYLAGFFFGRTPLIKLSPKKTWEGFIGGMIGTLIASWYLAAWMSQSAWLTCPRTDLSIWKAMECTTPPEMYQPRDVHLHDVVDVLLPDSLVRWVSNSTIAVDYLTKHHPFLLNMYTTNRFVIHAAPMQFHAIALAIFASAIAPFGGFFASGFKRGFDIKDFGDSIPGHGGMTDRMDCQVVMAAFSYIYFHTYVAEKSVTMGTVLAAAMKLTPGDQIELLEHLVNSLVGQQVLAGGVVDAIAGYFPSST